MKDTISEALQAGQITIDMAKQAFANVAQAKTAETCAQIQADVANQHVEAPQTTRLGAQTAFTGGSGFVGTSGLTKREVVRAARKYLNEGLYGEDLRVIMLSRFDPRDVTASQEELRPVLANQGFQGIAYIDPSVYADYGHGCEEAMRLYRSRGVKSVLACASCANCVSQTKPGHCSKLNKALVTSEALPDKTAFQKAIFATGKATETRCEDLVNNGHSVVFEHEMERHAMEIELDPPAPVVKDVVIMFGQQGIKL